MATDILLTAGIITQVEGNAKRKKKKGVGDKRSKIKDESGVGFMVLKLF
ncbi:MAG: hypothetical protein JXJ17_08185 [Anaerolineae bacterium]|nr:hypothetical protein [Anaerolineae bacterium]